MPPNTSFTKKDAIPRDATFDPSSLKGKSVLITGGASGIGEACLRAFVAAGAFVTFGDLADDRGEALVAELGSKNVAYVHCNVTDWNDQLTLFKTSLSKSPSQTLDIVLANAGINRADSVYLHEEHPSSPGEPIQPDLSIIDTNLTGVIYTAKLSLFYFPKQPEGEDRDRSLIITGSMASFMDHPSYPQYNISKWGVRGLMRSLRRTGPGEGIRVNLIAPWFTNTRIIPPNAKSQIEATGIEFVEIQDAASAFLHFASDTSINGRSLAIVPRSISQRGYLDLELDDVEEGDFWGLVRTTAEPMLVREG